MWLTYCPTRSNPSTHGGTLEMSVSGLSDVGGEGEGKSPLKVVRISEGNVYSSQISATRTINIYKVKGIGCDILSCQRHQIYSICVDDGRQRELRHNQPPICITDWWGHTYNSVHASVSGKTIWGLYAQPYCQ